MEESGFCPILHHEFFDPVDATMAPIIFWVPDTGTRAVHIEFSKNRALILMGDWCGSKNRAATKTIEKFGCDYGNAQPVGQRVIKQNDVRICIGEGFFI